MEAVTDILQDLKKDGVAGELLVTLLKVTNCSLRTGVCPIDTYFSPRLQDLYTRNSYVTVLTQIEIVI